MSSQIEHVSRTAVQQSVRTGKTSDMEVLRAYGRPALISQRSNGEKLYAYHVSHTNIEQNTIKSKSINFLIGTNNRVKSWTFQENIINAGAGSSAGNFIPAEDEGIVVRLLERVPPNASRKQLLQFLGKPASEDKSACNYLFKNDYSGQSPMSLGVLDMSSGWPVTFMMNRSGRAGQMILEKPFYEQVSQWAHFRIKVLTFEYRAPDDRENNAIAEYTPSP
ncbi:MAG: hypothetical protein NC112_06555 [Oxalobacter formigenes]|nr:hypothetical protein [Oxalobacter formigenes]